MKIKIFFESFIRSWRLKKYSKHLSQSFGYTGSLAENLFGENNRENSLDEIIKLSFYTVNQPVIEKYSIKKNMSSLYIMELDSILEGIGLQQVHWCSVQHWNIYLIREMK